MREILPSVGIDIGTSTTQVIFSKLELRFHIFKGI